MYHLPGAVVIGTCRHTLVHILMLGEQTDGEGKGRGSEDNEMVM